MTDCISFETKEVIYQDKLSSQDRERLINEIENLHKILDNRVKELKNMVLEEAYSEEDKVDKIINSDEDEDEVDEIINSDEDDEAED